MSKVVCMIPARYGSRRFEGKALADLHGKPMIQRVYERVIEADNIDLVAVVTDDKRIYDTVKGFGGNVMMSSRGHNTGTDRIAEVVDFLNLEDRDIVVNVQGDQPRISPMHIEQVVLMLLKDELQVMSTLAFRIDSIDDIPDSNVVKVVFGDDGTAIYFSRCPIPYRQSGIAVPYYKHLGIYAYRVEFLKTYAALPQGALELAESLEQLRAIENGYRIAIAVTDIDSPSVDTPSDLKKIHVTTISDHGRYAG